MRISIFLILVLLSFSNQVWSQQMRQLVTFEKDTIQLNQVLIDATSIELKSSNTRYQKNIDYAYLPLSNQLVNYKIPSTQILYLSYKYSSYPIQEKLALRNTSLIHPEIKFLKNPFALEEPISNYQFNAQSEGIQTTGSLMRGFVFGNAMNANVNSNLNLQLSGKLQNDINLLAAISDDNNPIQPEGNTRDIQDFDQVFVQFSKDKHQVLLGDFLMASPGTAYFLNYYKKSRGLHVSTAFQLSKKLQFQTQADLAISRGRFVRNAFNGTEGNQGPYRLTGPNGELFIVVISGTEVVYYNGERLTRGEQNDYTIDYNSGEITFMPKRLIQTYARIVVEFQYSDRNYARTLYNQHIQIQKGNSSFQVNFYTEQDNKNQPFQQALSENDIAVLKSVGNQIDQAQVSAVTGPYAYNAAKIQYRVVDTLGYKDVYINNTSASSDTVFYEIKFSFVGANKGNYIQGRTLANGRVFQWVAPLNGIPQGDFAPVKLLVAPNQRQMLTVGYTYTDARGNALSVEMAGSNDDKNTFSDIDNVSNHGYAFRLMGTPQKIKLSKNLQIDQQINAEYTSNQFNAIERFRSVEFARNWQRQINNSAAAQSYGDQLYAYQVGINSSQFFQLNYQIASYLKTSTQFNGVQQIIQSQFKHKTWLLKGIGEWLGSSQNNDLKNQSYKLDATLNKQFYHLVTGYQLTQESSLFKWKNDSLTANSFAYQQHRFFVQNKDTLNLKTMFEAIYRTDNVPIANRMAYNTKALDLKGSIAYLQSNLNQFRLDIAFREFMQFNLNRRAQTMLARLEYDYGFWQRNVIANTYLQTAGANELARDYQFVEVPLGQGIYVWKDFNQNGNAELNEFLLAGITEKNTANYIKIFLPSSSLLPVQSNMFNQTINLQHFSPAKNSWFYKFSNQTAYRFEQKKQQTANFSIERFLPVSAQDSQLMSMNTLFRNTIFYNKTSGDFGLDYTYLQTQSKFLQTNGSDFRSKKEHVVNFRYNLNETWTINASTSRGEKQLLSNWLNAGNYAYSYFDLKPKLNYQYKQYVRLTTAYTFTSATNNFEGNNDAANLHEFSGEARIALPKSGTFFAKYSYVDVLYNGNVSSVLAYEILQGLANGKNQLWTIQWQHRLGGNIQINLVYDGRLTGILPVVHIGKMEARYVF